MRRILFIAIAFTAAVGCQPADPKLQKLSDDRFAARVDGMGRTLKWIGDSEASRLGKTEANIAWIGKDLEGSAQRLERNWRWTGSLLKNDMERFFVRNPPLYRRKALELLWCDPEAIAPNAITLLW